MTVESKYMTAVDGGSEYIVCREFKPRRDQTVLLTVKNVYIMYNT